MGQITVPKILIFFAVDKGTRRPGIEDERVLARPENTQPARATFRSGQFGEIFHPCLRSIPE
jgi:hypothetical protein